MGRLTDAIKHILIVNVLFFVATALYGDQMYEWFSLWFPKNENFGLWQMISHMFMHGGFMHIGFNMYALWAFGTPLERMWGRNKFLFFYFEINIVQCDRFNLVGSINFGKFSCFNHFIIHIFWHLNSQNLHII